MKKIAFFFAFSFLAVCGLQAQDAKKGQEVFSKVCFACHTIGEGKRVGPDLNNVTTKRNEKWLISFIQSSQTMVKKGDKDAVAIFNEFNKIQMPDNKLTDAEVKNVLAYIKSKSKKK
jgi:cytochrome c2